MTYEIMNVGPDLCDIYAICLSDIALFFWFIFLLLTLAASYQYLISSYRRDLQENILRRVLLKT